VIKVLAGDETDTRRARPSLVSGNSEGRRRTCSRVIRAIWDHCVEQPSSARQDIDISATVTNWAYCPSYIRVQLLLSTDFASNSTGEFVISLGIDLCDVRLAVSKNYLCSFDPVGLANLRSRRVSQLVRFPNRQTGFFTRPSNCLALRRNRVFVLRLSFRVRFPLLPPLTARVIFCNAIPVQLLNGLAWRK
jgi:hypothetical protein